MMTFTIYRFRVYNWLRGALLLIAMLFVTNSLQADDVSVDEALRIAGQFADSPQTRKLSKRKAPARKAEPTLAHAMRSKVASEKDNVYVINLGNEQGFVVVSGETGTEDEVLGYCDHGSFSYYDAPVQVKDLLAQYSAEVDSLRQNPALAVKAPRRAKDIGSIVVGPLLTTTWSQWVPYNNQCPKGCPSGCVPTAIAQIMNYWKWPKVSQGNLLDRVTGQPTGADFSGHVYDWDNMLDHYRSGYNAEQAASVAKLMADIGTAWGTSYRPEGSSTYIASLPFSNNFGYDPDIEQVTGNTAANVQVQMKNELDQQRPVFYCGYPAGDGDGHALVCDGYTSDNYFHFNYGWDGSHDGWFKSALVPKFPNSALIWTGIRPIDGQRVTIGDMEYLLCPNGEAQIIQYVPTGVSNVVLEIPDTVEDGEGNTYTVTRIWKNAFYSRGNFDKITIGGNIKSIHQFSFISSTIDTLVIGDKMEEVPDGAFQLTQIQHLTIGASVRRIGKRAFRMCRVAQVVSRSPGFEVDDEAFFEGGSGSTDGEWFKCITKLGSRVWASVGPREFAIMPQFVQLREIKAEAFKSVKFPNTVTFPNPNVFHVYPNLKIIHPGAFEGSNLRYFEVDEDNPYFSMVDAPGSTYMSVLFNKNKTSVVASLPAYAPIGSVYYETPYPETVVKLEPGSVAPRYIDGTCTRDFIIPKTIVEMEGAFKNCYNLYNLICLAPVPPVVSDTTFNEKLWNWRVSQQTATLKVPAGTEELYRNAPGWRQFSKIEGVTHENASSPFDLTPPQNQQYSMVIHYTDENEGPKRVSIPVTEVGNMQVNEEAERVVVSRSGHANLSIDVAKIDSITWMPGFVLDDAEVFDMNDSTLTAVGQKCSVTFDATVIDKDVQLCIRNSVLTPNVLEGTARGLGIDLSLSNGDHELCGTVTITIPFEAGADENVHAAYFNPESGEWEPVYFTYDEDGGNVVITTDHLSFYTLFTTINQDTRNEMMELVWEECPQLYTFNKATEVLLDIVSSDDPDKQMINQFKDDMSFWQAVGLDVFYNSVVSVTDPLLKFKPEAIDNAVTAMGYLGTAVNIMNVVGAAIKGDDVGVAAGTLNTICSFAAGQMASAIGTPIMSASMGCVAFIGIALNSLGTKVQQRKYDLYNNAYRYFYSEEGSNKAHGCYRSLKDWYNFFYPVFAKGEMPDEGINAYVEACVRDYCDQFWLNKYADAYTFCCIEKDVWGGSSYPYPERAMQQQISEAYMAELFNGGLVSVFAAIKHRLAVEANKRYLKAAKDVAAQMNTRLAFQFKDSSRKKGEKSKYAGWTVAFSQIPKSAPKPETWTKTINDDGWAGLGWFTEYTLVKCQTRSKLSLYDENGVEQKVYDFEIPAGTGKVVIDFDLATGGTEVEVPQLKNLELSYDPVQVETFYTWAGTWNGGQDYNESKPEVYVLLDNSLNKNARFQTEIEKYFKRHDFISVDESGNIKIGDDIVGKFEGEQGAGSFTLNTTHQFTERTVQDYLTAFNKGDFGDIALLLNLLNGTIQHKIDCLFTVTKNPDGEDYVVSYTGQGTYNFKAEVVDRVEGVDFDNLGNTQHVIADQITTREVTQDGKVTLQYTVKLK